MILLIFVANNHCSVSHYRHSRSDLICEKEKNLFRTLSWQRWLLLSWSLISMENTLILPNFLVWKFCRKAQHQHSFGWIAQNYAETVPFRKIPIPGNQMKLRCYLKYNICGKFFSYSYSSLALYALVLSTRWFNVLKYCISYFCIVVNLFHFNYWCGYLWMLFLSC